MNEKRYSRILILLFGITGFVRAFQSSFVSPSNPPIATVRQRKRARIDSLGSHLRDFIDHSRFLEKVGGASRQFMSKTDGTEKDESQIVSFESEQSEDAEELDEDTLAEIESGQPSEWMVMKELLGINFFTYVLGAAIIFFLSMNIILGPGWLGNSLGIVPNWDMTQTADSIPATVDLSDPDFLI